MAYLRPTLLEDALDILASSGSRLIAGGTDWFPANGDKLTDQSLLDVTALPGFRGISRDQGGWRIGAATRWTDIIRADLPSAFDGLKSAAREVGSVQIQNAGTIAGNICNASPAADGVPPLLTLNASVEITSRQGQRVLPLADFITGVRKTTLEPGELVSAVLIPAQPACAAGSFLKLGARRYLVISIAMVAVLLEAEDGRIKDIRVAVGACSPVARRLPSLEADLIGHPLDAALPEISPQHLAPLSPIDDVRGSADYRTDVVAELIRRVISGLLPTAKEPA